MALVAYVKEIDEYIRERLLSITLKKEEYV